MAVRAAPTFWSAAVFSAMLRCPFSVDGNVGRRFSPKTCSVNASALLPAPRRSV